MLYIPLYAPSPGQLTWWRHWICSRKRDVDYVYPVTEYAHPIQRAMRRLANGQMQFINPQYALGRTQDMEKTYHDAGQFYWGKTSAWLDHKEKQSNGLGMPIPQLESSRY